MAARFKPCSVDGCNRDAHHSSSGSRGFCPAHYRRFRVHGDPLAGRIPNGTLITCKVDGCGNSARRADHGCKGYCSRHYFRFAKYGDPLAGRTALGEPLQWIKNNASYHGDDCLAWPFETTRWGYGTVKHNGKKRPASRVMCIFAHGDPPTPKHEAAHSCGNGHAGCMNQNHLRWATKTENVIESNAHGTKYRGEKCHWSRLTENDVREIRQLGKTMLQREIAKIYGVRAPAVGRILSGKRWGWLKDYDQAAVELGLNGKRWRKLILQRDEFSCRRCGSANDLDAHHIDAHSQNEKDRDDPNNGITLCKSCHLEFHGQYGYRHFGREQLNEYLASFANGNQ